MDDGARARDASRPARWSRTGLLVGAAVPLPAAVLALSVPAAERLVPLLVPGAALLRPLSAAMAGWNGAVNVLLVSVVNGLLYAAVAAGLGLLLGRRRSGGAQSSAEGHGRRPRAGRRPVAKTVLAVLALLVVAAAVAVSALAGRDADQAARDVESYAAPAGGGVPDL